MALNLLAMNAVPWTPDGRIAWQLIRGDDTPALNNLTAVSLRRALYTVPGVKGVILNVDRSNKYKIVLHVIEEMDANILRANLTRLALGVAWKSAA